MLKNKAHKQQLKLAILNGVRGQLIEMNNTFNVMEMRFRIYVSDKKSLEEVVERTRAKLQNCLQLFLGCSIYLDVVKTTGGYRRINGRQYDIHLACGLHTYKPGELLHE